MAIVSRKLQLAFASAILILIGMCVICYREMAATSESDQWVLHTHVVLNNIRTCASPCRVLNPAAAAMC